MGASLRAPIKLVVKNASCGVSSKAMRPSSLALVLVACAGCYSVAQSDAGDAEVRDVDDAELGDARLVLDREEAIALSHERRSADACPEWEEPVHPSPTVPPGALDRAVPLFRHRDEADPYMGDARFAPDGSIRLLGPSARTFVRIDRDGSIGWERDLGAGGSIWALAPDGSIFVAPSREPELRPRLLRILPDGTLATTELEVAPGSFGLGIVQIGFGPHGRVYLSNGSLLATCQGARVDWELSAFGVDRDARHLSSFVVDEVGDVLVTVGGVTRVLRISAEGERLEWMGTGIRSSAIDPDWAGALVTAVFGTRALIWAQIDSTRWMSSSIASPGEESTDSPDTLMIDGLGRLIRTDRTTRRAVWIWEQGDAPAVSIQLPCAEPLGPTFLEDGGVLCYAGDPSHATLRRVAPDGRVLWDFPVDHAVAFVDLDLDGRVVFGEQTGPYGETTLHVVQTTARPANAHWTHGRPWAPWARRR